MCVCKHRTVGSRYVRACAYKLVFFVRVNRGAEVFCFDLMGVPSGAGRRGFEGGERVGRLGCRVSCEVRFLSRGG